MEKDFDTWNRKKKTLDAKRKKTFFHEREIWWCAFGTNVGFEQDGTGINFDRPALILKGMSAVTCLVIPLTSSASQHPLRPSIGKVENEEAHALLSQLRVIDTKRLVRKIGYLDKDIFETIRKAVRAML